MKRFKTGVSGRRKLILTSIIGLGVLVGVFVVPTVYAFNKFLPGGLDVEAGGNPQAIELHLKNLDAAQVTRNRIAAYYPGWDVYSNGKSIKITDGPQGQICNIQNDVNGKIFIDIANAVTTQTYERNVGQVCGSGSTFFGETFVFPNGAMAYDPHTNLHHVDITVRYETNRPAGATKSDLNYKMHLTGISEDVGKLALKQNSIADQFGMRSSYTNDPSKAPANNLRIAVPFGYHCSVPINGDAENRTVRLYDADAVFGDTYMWVTRNGAKLPQDAYANLDKIDRWDGANNRWKLGGSNDSANVLSIKQNEIIRGARYELHVVNTGNDIDKIRNYPTNNYNGLSVHYNTLSVGIPQDGIYGEGLTCDYALRPRVTIDQSAYVYYPNIRVDGTIDKTGDGPVPDNHPWQMFAVRFSGEPSTRNLRDDYVPNSVNPCSTDVMPAGAVNCGKIADANYAAQQSHTVNPYNSGGPDPVGTRLCFFARIQNPTHLIPDDDQWAYSDMTCSVSLKKPRVQFRGSDVRVGGNAISSYYKVQNNNYGSWAEYGMFTSGINSIVSSGNSLRDGNPDDNVAAWNRLTFANTTSPYGNYGVVPTPSSAYTYFRNLPTSGGNFSQGNPTTGVYDLGNNPTIGNLTVNANGQSIVLRATGTIKIGNIIVRNEGVTRASDLSQVVIVAENIDFSNSSDRADAWLITSPTGYINTCDTGVTTLTSNVCPNTLTVNGPVYTNRLLLRRSAGANPPTAADFATPAEKFNLRPDAQLWAYTYANKADYAQTDFVQELPPRY